MVYKVYTTIYHPYKLVTLGMGDPWGSYCFTNMTYSLTPRTSSAWSRGPKMKPVVSWDVFRSALLGISWFKCGLNLR